MVDRMDIEADGRGRHWRFYAWGGAASLIALPLVAMQFTSEVLWGPEDFALAAAMIGGVGLMFELALRMTGNKAYLAGVGIALTAAFMLVWSDLAVGIIGSEDNPANLMFFAIPALGLAGAVVGRFRPGAMALAMLAAGIAQLGIAAVALLAGLGPQESGWPREILSLSGFFTALWLISAWCFGRAEGGAGAAQKEGASQTARP